VLQAAMTEWAAYGSVDSAFEECWDRAAKDRSSHIVIMETSDRPGTILSLDDTPAESLDRLEWLIGKIRDLTEWGFERMKLVLGPELGPRILATPDTLPVTVDLSRTKHLDLHLLHNTGEWDGTSTSSLL
jgi:hypothetical protein